MSRALVILAAGAEEMETVIVVDVLRRAGVDVILAGLSGPEAVECSRKVKLLPDAALDRVSGTFDLIVLPGGAGGAKALAESAAVAKLLQTQEKEGRWIGAVCAAPIALAASGVGKGKELTSHPSVKDTVAAHGRYSEARVVRDGKLITSRGPGTSFEFALALVEALEGVDAAQKVAGPMLVK